MRKPQFTALITVLLLTAFIIPTVAAQGSVDSSTLRKAVKAQNIRTFMRKLDKIGRDNNNTRASGTDGYNESSKAVFQRLQKDGYEVEYQNFDFIFFRELSPAILNQVAPVPATYVYAEDYSTLTYSGSGSVTASVQAVDLLLPPVGGSTSGCEPADFAGFTPGNIALVQRGTCDFYVKAVNAEAAGASAIIIFNEGNSPDRTDIFGGTLGDVVGIPSVSASYALGIALNNAIAQGLQVTITTNTFSEPRTTRNVIAQTPGGDPNSVIMVGAHLDSVEEGPGINDNASGSAMILEIARQLMRSNIPLVNKVRFAFWGAEEANLVGSTYYVSQLTEEEGAKIALYLNFDMVASPNFVRFVYDGDDTLGGGASPGPEGSGYIEQVFSDYFASQNLATEPTAFTGRSDYGPFIDVGIPAGGLFSGAEEIKTPEQAAIYGGTAGIAYDPCYHQACDTLQNINMIALEQFADAAAHTVLTFALADEPIPVTAPTASRAQRSSVVKTFDYKGNALVR